MNNRIPEGFQKEIDFISGCLENACENQLVFLYDLNDAKTQVKAFIQSCDDDYCPFPERLKDPFVLWKVYNYCIELEHNNRAKTAFSVMTEQSFERE